MSDRRQESYAVRLEAAELARSREYPIHRANGDEQRYACAQYFMSFTKGLPHNPDTGLLQEAQDFVEFRRAIDDGFIDPFSDNSRVRHGAKFEVVGNSVQPVATPPGQFRQWEAPTAGTTYELQGPDAQAVTMAPAPPLLSAPGVAGAELILEMAEVYELALLRDKPFNSFEDGQGDADILASIGRLNGLEYIANYPEQSGRPRKLDSGLFSEQTVFRGSSPGVEIGPHLSQFLLIGNADVDGTGSIADGQITYGVLNIDQRVPVATPGTDYMITMADYVEVQRGLRPTPEAYVAGAGGRPERRFISTPRDLATYVHYDALYEAYLNACIILLGMGTPFDPTFDHLSGGGAAAGNPLTRRNAGGFALYGGPHILNLVTEVATRGLKAVRFQKFNNHIRLRPEALAARLELMRLVDDIHTVAADRVPPALLCDMRLFRQGGLQPTLDAVAAGPGGGTYLLPMAFPEGSPMHPAYGAGHATVAGACVTILKAFFDTSAVLAEGPGGGVFKRRESGDVPVAFRAPDLSNSSDPLVAYTPDKFLTLEGELNKLAANISIGRDMAGVHYFSDYYDSLRMGEEIALGILEEQALTYITDPCVLSVPTFDGDVVRIGRR